MLERAGGVNLQVMTLGPGVNDAGTKFLIAVASRSHVCQLQGGRPCPTAHGPKSTGMDKASILRACDVPTGILHHEHNHESMVLKASFDIS